MRASVRLFAKVALILSLAAPVLAAAESPAPFRPNLDLQTPAPTGRIVVKFTPGSGITVRADGLAWRDPTTGTPPGAPASRAPAAAAAAAAIERIDRLVAERLSGARLERRFSRPADDLAAWREAAVARGGDPLPDLNAWAQLTPVSGRPGREELLATVKALRADPAVETAFLEPVAVPASLGFDAFAGRDASPAVPAPPLARADTTPDFSALQGYLGPPPLGVNALAMAGLPGASGAAVTVVDIEGAWLWTHEDLTPPAVALGAPIDLLSWRNHGTAVIGVLRGTDNGLGVRGIAPGCAVGGSAIGDQSVADAIANAASRLRAGDIILIELHSPGPNANGNGQYGYLPMEFWQDNFEVIRLATAAGLIVCEAAGNGQQNLDDPLYAGLFNRAVRDSGAIMCGASDGSTLWPAWFSNYGSRVDLQGWGLDVTTCGYGALQGEPLPETQWYTNAFNGTSGASPIVTGAVACLQGLFLTAHGFPLDAHLARDLLRATGTPQLGVHQIGVRPDLEAAWAAASLGIGRVAGTVTDAGSLQPLPGTLVTADESGAFDIADAAGAYGFPFPVGTVHLTFASFFHETLTLPAVIGADAVTVLDAALTPLPAVALAGRVYDPSGASLASVRVTPLGVPLAGTGTDAGGRFTIPGAPSGRTYTLLFDGQPGYGAAVRTVELTAGAARVWPIFQELSPAAVDFEADDGGFTPQTALWSWGEPARPSGPAGGFSGDRCWGVGMLADYPDSQRSNLTSPAWDFSAVPALILSFHYWSETEAGYDGVKLQATRDSVWSNVTPLSGYTDQTLSGLFYRPGWSGSSGGWRGAVFDLTDFRGPTFRFRLAFGSDAGVTAAGFWVDDIAFDFGSPAAPGDEPPPALAAPALAVWPTPFNAAVTIAWRDASPGRLRLTVFDPRGRRVRTLAPSGQLDGAASGTLVWDGRDDAGAPVPSGLYLVRLIDGAGAVAVGRAVLAK